MKMFGILLVSFFVFNSDADIGAISKDLKRSDFAYAVDSFVVYGNCAVGEVYPNRNCEKQKKTIALPRAAFEKKIAKLFDTSNWAEWIESAEKQLKGWESKRDNLENVQIPKVKEEITRLETELKKPDLTENQKKILTEQLNKTKDKLNGLNYDLREAKTEIDTTLYKIKAYKQRKEEIEQEGARVIPAALAAIDTENVTVTDEGNELEKVMKPLREEYQNLQARNYCESQRCDSAYNTGTRWEGWTDKKPEETFNARYFIINENTAAGWVGFLSPRSTFKWDQSQHLPQTKMNSNYFHLDPVHKDSYVDGKADISFEVFTLEIYKGKLIRVFRLTNNTRPYDLNIGTRINCVSTGCSVTYGNNLEEVLKTLKNWGISSVPEELRNPIYY